MSNELDKIADALELHQVNNKKVKAVVNYFLCNQEYLQIDYDKAEFLSLWIKEEMFDDYAQAMIDKLLSDYNINYLDWCCRIPSVRKKLSRSDAQYRKFFFENSHDVRIKKWLKLNYPEYGRKRKVKQLELF